MAAGKPFQAARSLDLGQFTAVGHVTDAHLKCLYTKRAPQPCRVAVPGLSFRRSAHLELHDMAALAFAPHFDEACYLEHRHETHEAIAR